MLNPTLLIYLSFSISVKKEKNPQPPYYKKSLPTIQEHIAYRYAFFPEKGVKKTETPMKKNK